MSLLAKYNLTQITTAREEGALSFENCKNRILEAIKFNIDTILGEGWNKGNNMKKLLTKYAGKTVFSIRSGSKTIIRLAGLEIRDSVEQIRFLKDAYESIENNEFDRNILDFLESEKETQKLRKEEAKQKRKDKLKEAKKAGVEK